VPDKENNKFDFAEQEKKLSNERIKKAKQKLKNRFRKPEDNPVTYLEGLLMEENIPPHSIAALQFLKNKTRQLYGTRRFEPEDLVSAASEIVGRNKVVPNWMNTGKLYTFRYWPDGFVDLNYFDMNPLIFIVDFESKYLWRGINMHYLDPNLRNKLYYDLRQWLTNRNYDQGTRIRMFYQYLKRFKKYIPALTAMRTYKVERIRSEVTIINPEYWDICINIPSQRWVKKRENVVWHDTAKDIREKRLKFEPTYKVNIRQDDNYG
tara:strand:- start:97 stop:888 length:792 start_codon:yes stop_codon:yes gene_type:complete